MIVIFERPLLSGWVYPCTVADIQEQLLQLPEDDLEGLSAVGLVPATRKDCWADARYFRSARPSIHLYSWPESLCWRQPAGWKWHHIERYLAVELAFGMRVEPNGSRWRCHWDAEDLRRWILEHVLIHEVGHHVHRMQRLRQGLAGVPSRAVREQWAEDYALRYLRRCRPEMWRAQTTTATGRFMIHATVP